MKKKLVILLILIVIVVLCVVFISNKNKNINDDSGANYIENNVNNDSGEVNDEVSGESKYEFEITSNSSEELTFNFNNQYDILFNFDEDEKVTGYYKVFECASEDSAKSLEKSYQEQIGNSTVISAQRTGNSVKVEFDISNYKGMTRPEVESMFNNLKNSL